jgi:hypothetical protein
MDWGNLLDLGLKGAGILGAGSGIASGIMNMGNQSKYMNQLDAYNKLAQQIAQQNQAAAQRQQQMQEQSFSRQQGVADQFQDLSQKPVAGVDEYVRQLIQMSQQPAPFDVSRYYQPMSDAEQQARMRATKADMAVRGIPFDSSYATNLIGEQMAGTESTRYGQASALAANEGGNRQSQSLNALLSAMQNAYQQRNAQMAALGGAAGGGAPQFQTAGYPQTPNFPSMGTPDLSGIFRYFSGQQNRTPGQTQAPGTSTPGMAPLGTSGTPGTQAGGMTVKPMSTVYDDPMGEWSSQNAMDAQYGPR